MILNRSTKFKEDYSQLEKQGKDVTTLDKILVQMHCGNDSFKDEYKIYPVSWDG